MEPKTPWQGTLQGGKGKAGELERAVAAMVAEGAAEGSRVHHRGRYRGIARAKAGRKGRCSVVKQCSCKLEVQH